MFQLADPKKSVKWQVKLKVPTDKGLQEKSFHAYFFFKSGDEIQELIKQADDVLFLQAVVDSFSELRDEKGGTIKGTKNDIKKVCGNVRVKKALIDAFYEFNNGDLKN